MDARASGLLGQLERDRRSMVFMERALFPVFLIVAFLGRILPVSQRNMNGRRPGSLISEASELTHSVVPWFYVFR